MFCVCGKNHAALAVNDSMPSLACIKYQQIAYLQQNKLHHDDRGTPQQSASTGQIRTSKQLEQFNVVHQILRVSPDDARLESLILEMHIQSKA